MGCGALWLLFGSLGLAKPSTELSPEELTERDALIGKIASRRDYEASVARFRELWQKREALRADEVAEQKRADEAHKRMQADSKTVDGIVGSHCALYRDPKNPRWSTREHERRVGARWCAKELVRLPPKMRSMTANRSRCIASKRSVRPHGFVAGADVPLDRPLTAQVGDLVLLCIMSRHSEGSGSKFPPDFRENILSQGFAVRIKEPPLIVKKSQNPLPLLGEWRFRAAIDRVEWTAPPEQPVLNRLFVLEALPPKMVASASPSRPSGIPMC